VARTHSGARRGEARIGGHGNPALVRPRGCPGLRGSGRTRRSGSSRVAAHLLANRLRRPGACGRRGSVRGNGRVAQRHRQEGKPAQAGFLVYNKTMQAERQRRWYVNLTPEQREARRIRQRIANMTPEQRSRTRSRDNRRAYSPRRQSWEVNYGIKRRLRAAGVKPL
jgi:hypothetical protein